MGDEEAWLAVAKDPGNFLGSAVPIDLNRIRAEMLCRESCLQECEVVAHQDGHAIGLSDAQADQTSSNPHRLPHERRPARVLPGHDDLERLVHRAASR
jgi:hypothetical protein